MMSESCMVASVHVWWLVCELCVFELALPDCEFRCGEERANEEFALADMSGCIINCGDLRLNQPSDSGVYALPCSFTVPLEAGQHDTGALGYVTVTDAHVSTAPGESHAVTPASLHV